MRRRCRRQSQESSSIVVEDVALLLVREKDPAATGDRDITFPSENATGNYVKVVQRLPVRIRFDPNQDGLDQIRPGMSAEARVNF
jgi:hypothetical protein